MQRIDAAHAREGVQDDRQQAVQTQRRQRGLLTHAEHRNQKAQQRERRNGLHQRAHDEDALPRRVKLHRHDAERDADDEREQQRHSHEPQMFARALPDFLRCALRLRRRYAKELRGDLSRALLVGFRPCVHVAHGLLADGPLRLGQDAPLFGVPVHELFAGNPNGLIDGKVMPIILENAQIESLDLGVGRVHVDHVDRAVGDRLE